MFVPNAFSQDRCPSNISQTGRDFGFVKGSSDNLYFSPSTWLFCIYHSNGKLSVEDPNMNTTGEPLSHGLAKHYFESGALSNETSFVKGKKEGTSKSYYENGKLKSEATFKDDKMNGTAKRYNESGKLSEEATFKDGVADGMVRVYSEDGRLSQQRTYKNGMQDGITKSYRKNGKIFATFTYREGSPVSGLCNHTDGTTSPLTNAELHNWENGLNVECR